MLLEKGGQIALEGIKRLGQCGRGAQLWMCLVAKLKSKDKVSIIILTKKIQ